MKAASLLMTSIIMTKGKTQVRGGWVSPPGCHRRTAVARPRIGARRRPMTFRGRMSVRAMALRMWQRWVATNPKHRWQQSRSRPANQRECGLLLLVEIMRRIHWRNTGGKDVNKCHGTNGPKWRSVRANNQSIGWQSHFDDVVKSLNVGIARRRQPKAANPK